MKKYWYKDAIIYSLDIETFMDSNGDGIGDFKGLRHQLNYLSNLGINCIWLQPFYDSPSRDNGYDVRDYYQVDRRLGDLGNFAELVDEANELGMRILIDLVVNHTSVEHFWFQEARKDRNSPYRDFYIWSDKKPKDKGESSIFGGSPWKYDRKAKAYFYHTFYPFQPDLNISNKAVQKEIYRIMHFWLKLGVSGFRMDAVPHMITAKGNEKFDGDPHQVLRDLREFVESQGKDAALLAEVDVEPERYKDFLGKEDQMHMLLNFYLNNYIFLAFARQEAGPLIKALRNLPSLEKKEQLATFIRNHDELDLERLSDKERQEVLEVFAPEEKMRVYGRGIRRRLPPMLQNDRRRMELAYSLLFTLPGTPVLHYGQEIGMGDDLSLKERDSVRTIMQWSNETNAGFSNAPTEKLIRPLISDGTFGYKKINARDQHQDPNSLLNWMQRAINIRKASGVFGAENYDILKTDNPKVLVHRLKFRKGVAVAIHNFSDKEEIVHLKVKKFETTTDVFGDKKYNGLGPDDRELTISAFGYRWLVKKDILL